MKLSGQRKFIRALLCCLSATVFLFLGIDQLAQTKLQLPAPTGHLNDFAGVVTEETRQQLENVLANLKLKTGIEFDIAIVESAAGLTLADFSLQLAKDWNVGARTSSRKSLLLVLSTSEKTSLTRYSQSVQRDLPEDVLGAMGQRMRAPLEAGQFSEGLRAGVDQFVKALSQKLAFSTENFDQAPAAVATAEPVSPADSSSKPTDESAPAITRSTSETKPSVVKAPVTPNESAPRKTTPPQSATPDDDGDSETVVLTLTRPLEERIGLLRTFLDQHPDSKERARAIEYLVSARAGLGDQRLKNGDRAGGLQQFAQAITDAPVDASEKLFSGVVAQIPFNLYLRGEAAAATKAAQDIEAKFGTDAKRLVALSSFYVRLEQGAEAIRLTTKAVEMAPDLADTHLALGLALRVALRLDEASAEYKRALELDPTSKPARRSLADLSRAFGKAEEALALYQQELESDPKDKAARTGWILSLLDLGRSDEAKAELDKALKEDSRNLPLLAGAAYWFAAHNDGDAAFMYGSRAVNLEPRYTWSQVAMARTLLARKRPLDAERALRFARQYGKFPTLDYELATVLTSAGLYDEAAEVLLQTFSLKDDQIETRLAGQTVARNASFLALLAPERRASLFQSTPADSESNAKQLKALLAFATFSDPEITGGTINEGDAVAAGRDFASGDDVARVYRQLFVASRLLERHVGFQTAYDLSEAARSSAEAGMGVPELTVAVQAEELRGIRARAIAAGGTPDIPEAPRNVLSNLLRGRIEDTAGWARFNQDKLDEAVDHLKRAVAIIPEGTPAARTSLWRLGVALERQDKKSEALPYYMKSYELGERDPVRRTVIENLYRKINGSLDGLDDKIGPALVGVGPASESSNEKTVSTPAETASSTGNTPAATPAESPSSSPSPEPAVATAQPSPSETPTPTPEPSPTAAAEVPATAKAAPTPTPAEPSASPSNEPTPATTTPTPEATPEATATPTPEASASPTQEPAPSPTPEPSATPMPEGNRPRTVTSSAPTAAKVRQRTNLVITGRVETATGSALANVVVVLISPQGTVLASTTDEQGNYWFTIAISTEPRSYRIIPSKSGLSFEPLDRVVPLQSDDMRELDFVGSPPRKP